MEATEELENKASDLWYSLREDYSSSEKFAADFKQYLNIEVALIKAMPDEKRLDYLAPIAHDCTNARNIAYSLITTISEAKDKLPTGFTADLNELLSVVADAFATPNYSGFWTDLYASVEQFSKKI